MSAWPSRVATAVRVTTAAACLTAVGVCLKAAPLNGQLCTTERVSRDELVRVMGLHGDYDILATTNRGRFTTELLLRLGREAHERDPDGPPLSIDPDDWFTSYLETAGITADEAPVSSRLGYQNRQWVMIEHRPERVVSEVKEGPEPKIALSVRAWWPKSENPASKFSFEDVNAKPRLKVTSRSEVTYRLLQFDDMVVIDEMEGLTARPTSGDLGALFRIIGEASLKQSRMAESEDRVQVARTRSSRLFSVTVTSTIDPDGNGRKGIPDGRPDLEEIEARLGQTLDIEYVPDSWASADEGCRLGAAGTP